MDMEETGVIQFEQFKAAHSPNSMEPEPNPTQKASVASVLGQPGMREPSGVALAPHSSHVLSSSDA